MTRISYILTDLPTPANMPGWARMVWEATQSHADEVYKHGPGGLDNFYGQADGWLQTQMIKRGSNANYKPDVFPMAIPQRTIVDFDERGVITSHLADPDPNILMPELPPLPPAQPSQPSTAFKMTGTPPDQQAAQMAGQIITLLMDISNKLDTLLARK